MIRDGVMKGGKQRIEWGKSPPGGLGDEAKVGPSVGP
jgi:hypothetical protein